MIQLKNQYNITGYYYQIKEHTFRKYLNIQKKDSIIKTPDIQIIMMNPGGSLPKSGNQNGCTETPAIPDKTQNQIMEVMHNCNFEYARILNLSDYRNANSNELYKMIPLLEAENIAHSIFEESRTDDLESLWVNNIPVIFAWGVNTKLKSLAEKAIEKCNVSNPIGLQKLNIPWAYYHPLPRINQKQIEWVNTITNQI